MDAPGWSTDEEPTAGQEPGQPYAVPAPRQGVPAGAWPGREPFAYPPLPPFHEVPTDPGARPRDGVSIAAFVTGLLGLLLVSLVLAIAGLVRTAQGRRRGRPFAIAGLALSVAWAVVLAVALPGLVSRPAAQPASASRVAVAGPTSLTAPAPSLSSSAVPHPSPSAKTTPNPVPPPKPVPARKEYVEDLRAGDCMLISKLGDSVLKIPVVPCRQAHDAEVVGVTRLPGRWHGQAALERLGNAMCDRLFERYVGVPADVSDHGSGWFGPTADSWQQGDRLLVCYADDGGATRTGSIKGTDT